MMFKASLLALTVAAVHAQCPAVPDGGCNICGPGLCVQNSDAVFSFPSQPSVPCGLLESAGFGGSIPLASCPLLPNIITTICDCGAPPVVDPEPTPAPAPSCPEVPPGGCSICGEGMCISRPDKIFEFPSQPSVPCDILQEAGFSGAIPLAQCPLLPALVGACECNMVGVVPTGAPVEPPTTAPVVPPTNAPVAPVTPAPTNAPIVGMTAAPISPTASPVAPTASPVAPTGAPLAPVPTAPTPFPIFILTPQPTPTDELAPPSSSDDGGMMGMGMMEMSEKTSMSMAMMGMGMDRRQLRDLDEGIPPAYRGA